MAKTIKFNLICDGNPVRTLEDLKNNFSIEDVIKYFDNKLLDRWLSVRGYNEELKKVEELHDLDLLTLVKELIKIFDIDTDPVTIAENTYIFQYKREAERLLREYKNMNFKKNAIIDDYHSGYTKLIDTILNNKNDIAKIKAAIKEINRKYASLYEMDYRNLFYILITNAPLAVFVMLMNENMRKKYLPFINENENDENENDENENDVKIDEYEDICDADKESIYEKICCMLDDYDKLEEMLGDNLKVFCGETDGYWKDVEAKGKKYLILSIENGNYIRNAGVLGGDLEYEDIYNKFIILNGIDYKSNNSSDKLLYMEV